MKNDISISVENISKAYRIWDSPSGRLQTPLLRGLSRMLPTASRLHQTAAKRADSHYRDFYALENISFQIRRGGAMGIIGRNGSGKSTLLQIIAGTLQPTSGSLEINGRVAALLELGSGFNPDFTGRENVYLGGSVLGFSRREMDKKFAEIAAFAEIGEFMDEPVKTYSTGMLMRLAFSVQIAVNPDILIIDEALSVGDVFFQQKCFQRLRELIDSGITLLFVSHDTGAVQNLCDRAILLKEGACIFEGPPEEAASRYYATSMPTFMEQPNQKNRHDTTSEKPSLDGVIGKYDIRDQARSEHGARELEVEQVALLDLNRQPNRDFKVGDTMVIALKLRAHADIADPSAGVHLFDRMNNLVFAAGTRQLRVAFANFRSGETRTVEFQIELSVQPGEYSFSVGCSQRSIEGPNLGYVQHRIEGLGPVTVIPVTHDTWPFYGAARLPMLISIHG